MKVYTIPEALVFLAAEYGANKMPTSQETLRRAIRTGELCVQEEGDPGRKGYTISEVDLRSYARNRLARMERRGTPAAPRSSGTFFSDSRAAAPEIRSNQEAMLFHELYAQYLSGELDERAYLLALYKEKTKWEGRLREKREQLINLTSMMESLKNEIAGCEANIDDYQKGINKIDQRGNDVFAF